MKFNKVVLKVITAAILSYCLCTGVAADSIVKDNSGVFEPMPHTGPMIIKSTESLEKYATSKLTQIQRDNRIYWVQDCTKFETRVDKIISKEYKSAKSEKYKIKSGAKGQWVIPDVGVNISLFNGKEQKHVDKEGAGAYFKYYMQDVIADHNYQGFDKIGDCKVGTMAFLYTGGKKKEYVCTKVFNGYNTGNDFKDLSYRSLKLDNPGGIMCYTCRNNSYNVKVAYFEPVDRNATVTFNNGTYFLKYKK